MKAQPATAGGRSTGDSEITAEAPCPTAWGTKAAPSAFSPLSARKAQPGRTSRLSLVRSATWTSGPERRTARPSMSRSSFMATPP